MTLPDVTPMLPSEDELAARHDALVAEFRRTPQTTPLGSGVRSRPDRRPRRHLAIAGVVVLAGAAAASVSFPTGGAVNVVAEARAATAPTNGGVLHTVVGFKQTPQLGPVYVVTGPPPGGKTLGTLTGRTERWSSSDPVRWRSVQYIAGEDGTIATSQESYADGVLRSRGSWEQAIKTYRLPDDRRAEQDRAAGGEARLGAIGGSSDPVVDIRRLLDSGKVRDEGERSFGGRTVRRLVGTLNAGRPADGSYASPITYEYLVDAESFAPVQITAAELIPARPNAEEPAARKPRTNTLTWTFTTFERLPATPENQELLAVQAAG